jgi:hypothetical protein
MSDSISQHSWLDSATSKQLLASVRGISVLWTMLHMYMCSALSADSKWRCVDVCMIAV